ncbi:MAG TPA: AraC family transcriptional regulator [Candidatus Mediterraneibacter excrementigallinarum]|nr:AraC family transcriptional regulator [Candidatus Mediterraneibacter excrementigallinarum]
MKDKTIQKEKHNKVEYRYYEMPVDSYVLPLLGERWITNYGTDSLHFHNYLEVGYCYYGKGKIMSEDKVYDYRDDTFTIIPKNVIHRTSSNPERVERWEYLFIDTDSFFEYFYRDDHSSIDASLKEKLEKSYRVSSAEDEPETAALIRLILDEARTRKSFYKESMKGLLQAFLVMAARVSETEQEEADEPERGLKDNRLDAVLEYISTHYSENICVSDLAGVCHISETHLRRLFQDEMNISPLEYINLVRIQAACHALRTTRKTIDEIRIEAGFDTASTFNRNFKKLVKMSPLEWRKRKKEKADYDISIYKGW